jgi:hypothetical protein
LPIVGEFPPVENLGPALVMPIDLFGQFPPLPRKLFIRAPCIRIVQLAGATFAV